MRNIQLCALCKNLEADKTGSHVVPAFILVSLIGKRNKEIGFEISSAGYVKKYIGREVSAEEINRLLDRELTEEDLAENKNLFVVDNLLCSHCESRLGTLENESVREINRLKEGKLDLKPGFSSKYFELESNLLVRCLFYSIIFRIAAAESYEYNLNTTLREKIRNLLDKTLSTEAAVLSNNLKHFRAEITSLPMSIFYAPLKEGDGGNQIYSHKPIQIPSTIIINEFIVCTYNKVSQTSFNFNPIFSIDKSLISEVINFNERSLKIGFIESRKKINDSLIADLAHKMNQNIGRLYYEVSIRAKGVPPSNGEIQEFVKEVALDDTQLFDKLKPEYLAKIMKKHLDQTA